MNSISPRKPEQNSKTESTKAAPVMFETFEPRILMSATPTQLLASPTVISSSSHPVVVQNSDGTQLSVFLTGHGTWQITQGANGLQLTVAGTDASSQLTLVSSTAAGASAPSGSHFLLNGIDLQAPIGSVSGSGVNVQGAVTVEGSVGHLALGDMKANSQLTLSSTSATSEIDLGNVTDLNLKAAGSIGVLAVSSWKSDGNAPSQITATSIGTLQDLGDFGASLSLSGVPAGSTASTLGSVFVGGGITAGLWHVVGNTGSVVVNGTVAQQWDGDFTTSVQEIVTKGDFDGQLATPLIRTLVVGGNLSNALLLLGADLGADGQLGGSGADADHFSSSFLSSMSVGGSIIASRIRVGIDPVDGVLDDGTNILLGVSVRPLHIRRLLT